MKALVYGVFALEIAQTVIRAVDRYEQDVMQYGNIAVLDDQLLDWFSTPVLSPFHSPPHFLDYLLIFFEASLTSAIVQVPQRPSIIYFVVLKLVGLFRISSPYLLKVLDCSLLRLDCMCSCLM
jgi:hypothetical protein